MYAAEHPRRREYRVGGSTAATLPADKVAATVGAVASRQWLRR
ncbi:hypothetical protein [Hamadaea tsunoensis]|nr:hypothetical protein [Hamadaea tsunoensis]